jgi:dsRNA-specific ribonuclease
MSVESVTKYSASRGEDFKNLIINVISKGRLKDKYIKLLTNPKSMEHYSNAFTAESFDKENNYERFEQIGDVAANHFVISYCYRRFPQLDCTSGVKVIARLRINYVSKDSFSSIAENLNFWPFISAAIEGTERNQKYRNRNKKDLLEDVLEAFIGCTEYLLDEAFRPGVGYGIVYDILESIFNELPMSLEYEDLYDAKTRLKETTDFKDLKALIGTLVYYSDKTLDTDEKICRIYAVPTGIIIPNKPKEAPNLDLFLRKEWLIGYGTGNIKSDAEQKASEMAIKTLKSAGIFKEPPPEYSFFCKKK